MLHEFTSPAPEGSPSAQNLCAHVIENAHAHPDQVVFQVRRNERMVDITASQFHQEVREVAKGLMAQGIQAGQRIGLMSRTRYEWTLFDYAIGYAGAVSVPIYETSSAQQVQWILEDSQAVAIILESDKNKRLYASISANLQTVTRTWVLDDNCVDLLKTSAHTIADAQVDARQAAVGLDDPATIIYTSGTTGRPKGCVITQSNFVREVDGAIAAFGSILTDPQASTLLFLPLAHVFGRIIELAVVRARTLMAFCADPSVLVPELQAFRPTFILAVPRVFEKVYNTSQQTAAAEGKGRIFDAAVSTAISYSKSHEHGSPNPYLRLKHALFDALVYKKIRTAMGGRVQYAISGGAPLGARLGHFFRGIGVTIGDNDAPAARMHQQSGGLADAIAATHAAGGTVPPTVLPAAEGAADAAPPVPAKPAAEA